MARLRLEGAEDLPLGASRIVPHPEGAPPRRSLILVRLEAGLRAYWNVCAHLPVPLDSGAGALPPGDALVCLTHGARYATDTGRCLGGPCRGGKLAPVELVQVDGAWFAEV